MSRKVVTSSRVWLRASRVMACRVFSLACGIRTEHRRRQMAWAMPETCAERERSDREAQPCPGSLKAEGGLSLMSPFRYGPVLSRPAQMLGLQRSPSLGGTGPAMCCMTFGVFICCPRCPGRCWKVQPPASHLIPKHATLPMRCPVPGAPCLPLGVSPDHP